MNQAIYLPKRSVSVGDVIHGPVLNFSALPVLATVYGQYWEVLNSQGIKYVGVIYGGTYYPNGLYYADPVSNSWKYSESPSQANQATVDAGLVTDQFVSPATLKGSASLDQSGSKLSAIATGTNNYLASLTPGITSYSFGNAFLIKIPNTSTAATTLNLNSVASKKIFKTPTTQAGANDLTANQSYWFVYDPALDSGAGGFLIIGGANSKTLTVVSQTIGATPTIDLSTGDIFLLTPNTNVTSLNYSNETVGNHYYFYIIKSTVNYTTVLTAGRYRIPFGVAITTTDPLNNGTAVGATYSIDIFSMLCVVAGRLDVTRVPDMQNN